MAELQLSWYKFKHHYGDYIKVLVGIIVFEWLILFIQEKEFLKTFESTRMTLFLLLFASTLLILVQNSIYISRERGILDRDFFSTLSRMKYGLATLVMNLIFALGETLIFVIGYQLLTLFFDKELPQKGYILSSFHSEIFITVLLVFLCAHVMAVA